MGLEIAVSDIKKSRDKILRFKQEMCNMGMSKKAKVMKVGDDEQHDKPCTCGSSESEWRAYLSQVQYYVKCCPAAQKDVW